MDTWKVNQTIRRLAHQVLEDHYLEGQLAIVGVQGMGAEIARALEEELAAISDIPFECFEIGMRKSRPLSEPISFSGNREALTNAAVLLVDDVLNSGKTLSYAVSYLLECEPKSLKTVVLVDRIHRTFPIRADYYGMRLSTNIKEHVSVVAEDEGYAAYLD